MILFLLFPLNIHPDNQWELIKDKRGIKIYSKSGDNSEYIEIKGVSEVRSNLTAFVALMKDVNGFENWMHAAKETSLIEKNNEYHFSYYLHSDIPWPAKDRDVVLNFRIFRDTSHQVIYTTASNLKGKIPKKEGIRRIPSVKSSWRFVPIEGNRVKIIFETLVNPGIQLPDWLAEKIYQLAPYHTIKNMKQTVQKEKYQSARIDLNKIPQ
ncbi:MAG: hypothetical protein ACLFM7_06170 [Bacteroidales bacterium]